MTRPALLFALVGICLSGVAFLLWRDLRWGQTPGLLSVVEIVVLLAVGGVLFRSASEAWAVRASDTLSFADSIPEPNKLLADGTRLELRCTVTDQQGQTSKVDLVVRRIAKGGDVVWVLGHLKGNRDTPIAMSERAISHINEKQTGQFVADNIGGWLVSRAQGWSKAKES